MSDRSGVSRGDRNRNARLARLREAVPAATAIAGIDLADSKQMVVVTDHGSPGAGAAEFPAAGLGAGVPELRRKG